MEWITTCTFCYNNSKANVISQSFRMNEITIRICRDDMTYFSHTISYYPHTLTLLSITHVIATNTSCPEWNPWCSSFKMRWKVLTTLQISNETSLSFYSKFRGFKICKLGTRDVVFWPLYKWVRSAAAPRPAKSAVLKIDKMGGGTGRDETGRDAGWRGKVEGALVGKGAP